jgi:glycosyltransferase involved in cell wall biosynthesis
MTTDCVGGVWNYCLTLCKELAQRGVEITLAAVGPPPSNAQRAAAEAIANLRLHVRDSKLEWTSDPWDDLPLTDVWLEQLAQQVQPDCVHLNQYVHARAAFDAPVLVVAHSCVCSWWQAVHQTDAPGEWDEYRAQVREALQNADHVVAPSHAMLRAADHHYGPLPRASVIHNGAQPPQPVSTLKEHHILAAGRLWDEAKNLQTLRDCAQEGGVGAPIFLAGPATSPDGGTIDITPLHALGHLDPGTMADAYRRAKIFAHPARYEPFGLAVLEAAQHGCALVLGDIPSLRELWQDAAIFIPPNDAAALRGVLNELLADKQRCAQLGYSAQQRAMRYSADAMTENYLALYAQLAMSRAKEIV